MAGALNYLNDMRATNSQKETPNTDGSDVTSGRKIIKKSYSEILKAVRQDISTDHADELREVVSDPIAQDVLKKLIVDYINKNRFVCKDEQNLAKLTERIFQDMAGFGILSKYIYDPDVEEININSYRDIEVLYPQEKGGFRKIDERFESAQQAVDIVKRMCACGGITIDESQPVKDSYITKGVRCSAMITPIVDEEIGVSASIRRQKKKAITRDKLIRDNSAIEDELDLINMCITCGVSVGFTGGTGSGKTADMGIALSNIPYDKRIYTIEDSRELDLIVVENDKVMNRVIHTGTRPNEDVKKNVDAELLLKQALRQDPDIIVPAEMRGKEAWDAVEAGQTGHTVVTSVHANSAEDAYERIYMLCLKQNTSMSEKMLMTQIISAFPIIVFKKKLSDGSRRIMSIVEGIGYDNGKVRYNTLFRFQRTGIEVDEHGRRTINGVHKKVGNLSDKLALRMYENDAELEFIRKYARPDWDPDEVYNKIEKEAAGGVV